MVVVVIQPGVQGALAVEVGVGSLPLEGEDGRAAVQPTEAPLPA